MCTENKMCETIQKLSNIYFEDLIDRVEHFESKLDCSELYLSFISKKTHIENKRGGLNVTYEGKKKNLLSFESSGYYNLINKFFSNKVNILLVVENPETNEVDIIQ